MYKSDVEIIFNYFEGLKEEVCSRNLLESFKVKQELKLNISEQINKKVSKINKAL